MNKYDITDLIRTSKSKPVEQVLSEAKIYRRAMNYVFSLLDLEASSYGDPRVSEWVSDFIKKYER